jgi:hypothetical protein
MTDLYLYKDIHPDSINTDKAINLLNDSLTGFKDKWENFIRQEHQEYPKDRNDYIDIAEIARNIRDRILLGQTNDFYKFFDNLELILNNCDKDLEELMVVGLIEGIQNVCGGQKINYWTGFDIWLKPTTKKHWDNLIYSWEGKDAIERFKAEHPDNNNLIKF